MRIRTHLTHFVPVLLGAAILCANASAANAAPSKDEAPVASSASTGSGVMNINTATEDELTLLPGVGPAKAASIVSWRKKHGAFKKIDELVRVKGFGRKSFMRLKPFLAVSGTTTFHGKKSPRGENPELIPFQ
jgi:competence protein ComEA